GEPWAFPPVPRLASLSVATHAISKREKNSRCIAQNRLMARALAQDESVIFVDRIEIWRIACADGVSPGYDNGSNVSRVGNPLPNPFLQRLVSWKGELNVASSRTARFLAFNGFDCNRIIRGSAAPALSPSLGLRAQSRSSTGASELDWSSVRLS